MQNNEQTSTLPPEAQQILQETVDKLRSEKIVRQEDERDRYALEQYEKLPAHLKMQARNRGYIDVMIGTLRHDGPQTASKRHRHAVQEKKAGQAVVYRRVTLPGRYFLKDKPMEEVAVCGRFQAPAVRKLDRLFGDS